MRENNLSTMVTTPSKCPLRKRPSITRSSPSNEKSNKSFLSSAYISLVVGIKTASIANDSINAKSLSSFRGYVLKSDVSLNWVGLTNMLNNVHLFSN